MLMKFSSVWLRCSLFAVFALACGSASLHLRADIAANSSQARGLLADSAVEFEVRLDKLSSGQLRHGSFRFPVRSKRWHARGGSLAQGGTTCTLPKGLKFRNTTTQSLLDSLAARKPFTFLRLGDGDWYCALGGTGLDSNGVVLERNHGMCEELKQDILELGVATAANFLPVLGTFFLCKERSFELFAHVDDFFSSNPVRQSFSGFLDSKSVGFYFPLLPDKKLGRSPGVVPALSGQLVVVVGPKHLRKLNRMLNYTAFVEVPPHTCWEARDDIISSIKRESQRRPSDTVVFLLAGGIAARTILFKTFLQLGQKDSFIDVGSSLDGFAGMASRDYNKNMSRVCNDFPEYVADGVCDSHGRSTLKGTERQGRILRGSLPHVHRELYRETERSDQGGSQTGLATSAGDKTQASQTPQASTPSVRSASKADPTPSSKLKDKSSKDQIVSFHRSAGDRRIVVDQNDAKDDEDGEIVYDADDDDDDSSVAPSAPLQRPKMLNARWHRPYMLNNGHTDPASPSASTSPTAEDIEDASNHGDGGGDNGMAATPPVVGSTSVKISEISTCRNMLTRIFGALQTSIRSLLDFLFFGLLGH